MAALIGKKQAENHYTFLSHVTFPAVASSASLIAASIEDLAIDPETNFPRSTVEPNSM